MAPMMPVGRQKVTCSGATVESVGESNEYLGIAWNGSLHLQDGNLRKKLEGMEALGKLKLHLAAWALQIKPSRSPTLPYVDT